MGSSKISWTFVGDSLRTPLGSEQVAYPVNQTVNKVYLPVRCCDGSPFESTTSNRAAVLPCLVMIEQIIKSQILRNKISYAVRKEEKEKNNSPNKQLRGLHFREYNLLFRSR